MMEDEINFVMIDKVEGTEEDMVSTDPPVQSPFYTCICCRERV